MKKNGFTLVELIAVIVVLAILMVLVAPSILKSADASREKSFQTKVGIIETAAVMYGQDNYRNIVNGVNAGSPGYGKIVDGDITYNTLTLRVGALVPDYLEKDIDEGKAINGTTYYIQDPRSGTKFLDDYTITIKVNMNTRKVTAEFNKD